MKQACSVLKRWLFVSKQEILRRLFEVHEVVIFNRVFCFETSLWCFKTEFVVLRQKILRRWVEVHEVVFQSRVCCVSKQNLLF